MYTNYHTHTYRCGHSGEYSDEEFVLQAIQSGFTVLGFSDHTPWPYPNGFHRPRIRMDVKALPEYISSLRALQEKYRDQIHIYVGLECEYFPAYIPWLESQRDSLDYLILGNHWGLSDEHNELYYSRATLPEHVDSYVTYTIRGMETGLFSYLAHPDHVMSDYPAYDSTCEKGSYALCRKAKALGLPLEYNLVGFEKRNTGKQSGIGFPCEQFWKIAAEVGCRAIIGFDAHHPRQLMQAEVFIKAKEFLDRLGIEVCDTLPGLE